MENPRIRMDDNWRSPFFLETSRDETDANSDLKLREVPAFPGRW